MSSKRNSSADPDRIQQRYECIECGSPSSVHVHPTDREATIGYVCSGDCRGVTDHEPSGLTDWYSTPDRD